MTLKKYFIYILLLLPYFTFGQTFRFHNYTVEDGIAQNFIYSINQDDHGYVWIGTGEGLCRFDGVNFTTYKHKDGLGEDIITSSFQSENRTLWFGHNNGGISKYERGGFKTYSPNSHGQSTVNGFCEIKSTLYYIVQNEGLFSLSDDKLSFISNFNNDGFYSIEKLDDRNILLGTSNGLIHLVNKDSKWEKKKTYLKGDWVSSITRSSIDGIFLIGLQSGGLTRTRLKNNILEFSTWDGIDLSEVAVKTILEDDEHNIWLGTFGQGMIKLHGDDHGELNGQATRYNNKTGLLGDFVQSIFQDREGNIWIGTFGDGISTLIDDFFTFYSHDSDLYGNSINSLWIDDQNKWYGVNNGLIRTSTTFKQQEYFYTDTNGFVKDNVQALYQKDSTLWIGTENNGIYRYETGKEVFYKVETSYGGLENIVNQITGSGNYIYAATEGGVIIIDETNNETLLVNTSSGIAHNSINTVFRDSKGDMWIGGHSRYIYSINNNELSELEVIVNGELDVISITEDEEKNLWIGTAEKGLYMYNGEGFESINTDNGLFSNYTYSIKDDGNGNLWIGHRGALSKINKASRLIEIFDHDEGIKDQINKNTMVMDESGYLWIGTSGGSIKYDPHKDNTNNVAPLVNLISITVGDKKYAADEDINLPYGNYRVQFEYAGISFKHPDQIKYQFKLEGHDDIYSDVSSNTSSTYGRLSDGEYSISIIAYNEDGVYSENTQIIRLIIATPIWKKWWFYFIIILFISSVLLLLVRARIKRLKENQIYLEEQLTIKTKEVVTKAEKIEEINKDLTDSINYAKRIQRSMMPAVKILENSLPNSFIFFKPRDIVSGDFYFIERIQDKLIVACVDCTGHGVPGAFMSMIGSVTLRNIYATSKYEWKTPEVVLEKLDIEIETILQQKRGASANNIEELLKPKDGMDLTICEIDLNTSEVLLASAMRNSIHIKNGELISIKGDKRPIGGGEIRRADFTLKRFQMQPGDSLFLFTDGYPDQFGGGRGRKLKMSGLNKIIAELDGLGSNESLNVTSSRFSEWQDNEEQTDDVLMIGLRF